MPIALPFVPSVPSYRVSTVLDEVEYILDVRWNARDGAWYFDLYDADEDLIRAGIKVVLGTLLGRRCADLRFPGGAIIADDTSRDGREATLDDIGTRVVVMYFDADELGTGAAV